MTSSQGTNAEILSGNPSRGDEAVLSWANESIWFRLVRYAAGGNIHPLMRRRGAKRIGEYEEFF